jgi:hypothetical protein
VLRLLSIGPTRMPDDARRVAAGGAAQVAVMRASSEDRKAAGAGSGSGSPPAAAYRIQLKSADMKEEMRQEAVDIARVVRAASLLYSIRIISRCALPLSLVLTAGLLSVFFFRWGISFLGAGVREAHHGEGHRRVHQDGVRQEPRPDLALHRRPQLW